MYLAEHQKLGALRAIKQIPRKKADATPVLSEALLLKNLKHPGIPIVFDLEEDEKNIYVIEEYIAGESLEAFALHQSKISEKKIIQIGIQLCDILIYLHGQKPLPLLYLDMKPEHIFLCAGQVRLVDFGIAAYLDGKRSAYPSYGTKEFSAPEQWTSDQPGVWTDIFGAGRILSFLSEYASLPISRGLGRIIQRATQTDMKKRYVTAEAMKQELVLLEQQKIFKRKLRTEEHLLKKIAVCGSGIRSGTTHFSIALNSFFNEEGLRSFYREANDSGALWKIRKMRRRIVEKDGFLYSGHFCGATGLTDERHIESAFDFEIADYGCQVEDTAQIAYADVIILLLGARDWEKEEAWSAIERYRYCEGLVLVCNYGDEKTAREYAKRAGRRVYCFPLDADAFCVDAAKISFFRTLLQKERW